jgi:hypothetical protein
MPRIVCSLTLATVLVLAGSVLASGTDGIDITAGFGPHTNGGAEAPPRAW